MRHTDSGRDGTHDFDFYTGLWRVRNERLVERLKGCTEWEKFDALSEARILPGLGNMDVLTTDHWPGFVGMTVRLYDAAAGVWRLNWASNRIGMFAPPVIGKFADDGVGRFLGRDEEGGRPVIVRFTWSEITATHCRWEQDFSPDEGRTWEKNWIMVSTREDR